MKCMKNAGRLFMNLRIIQKEDGRMPEKRIFA